MDYEDYDHNHGSRYGHDIVMDPKYYDWIMIMAHWIPQLDYDPHLGQS